MVQKKEKGLPHGEAGQVLLIVVLVVIISLTVGLSLVGRTITNLRTSTEESDSQKALAAAEAGIERSIQAQTDIPIADDLDNGSAYSTMVSQINSSAPFFLNGGNIITKNEGADIWFANRDANDKIIYPPPQSPQFFHLYWGFSSEQCGSSTPPAAIQVIVVAGDSAANVKTYRYSYDGCSRGNNFTTPPAGRSLTWNGKTLDFSYRTPGNGANIELVEKSNIIFMRIIPLYANTVIGVDTCNPFNQNNGCTSLPFQGSIVTSTGVSGAANRKITIFKGYAQIYLPYLSYGLFVPGN